MIKRIRRENGALEVVHAVEEEVIAVRSFIHQIELREHANRPIA